MELGLSAVSQLDIYEIAGPHLRNLMCETGETAHLAVLRDGEVVSLVSAESTQTLRTPVTVGSRTPAHCTSLGKAMLAFTSREQVDAFLRGRKLKAYTRKTITSASRFRAELQCIRKRGYAVDNEERETGLRCIGAPVCDSAGEVIAAVSIAGPAFRISEDQIKTLSGAVVRTAARMSASLGYRETKGKLQRR
jgi:DNA-binding IclR family transcriptional regulator